MKVQKMKVEFEIPIPPLSSLPKKIVLLLLLAGVITGIVFAIGGTQQILYLENGQMSDSLRIGSAVGVAISAAILILIALVLFRKVFTA